MNVHAIAVNRILVNTYLLVSDNGEAVLIDPGCDSDREAGMLLRLIASSASRLNCVLLTHAHVDHVAGCDVVKAHYPEAPICAHRDAAADYRRANAYGACMGFGEKVYPPIDRFLEEGELISFGSDRLRVMATPGHAQGSVCYFHAETPALFSGDTLFCQSVGRCDLPGGDSRLLTQSLRKIAQLPEQTRIYPGHGETTDLYFELHNNPYLYAIHD